VPVCLQSIFDPALLSGLTSIEIARSITFGTLRQFFMQGFLFQNCLSAASRSSSSKADASEAVDHQPIVGRINFGKAAVMALETKPRRRDDPIQGMKRREIHR
jgi:hypothetical protein